jgi:hypothetical protein
VSGADGICAPTLLTIFRLQDLPHISNSAGNPLAIEVFEQWDGVLASHSEQILEAPDIHFGSLRFFGGNRFPQLFERNAMKNKLIAQLHQNAFAQ